MSEFDHSFESQFEPKLPLVKRETIESVSEEATDIGLFAQGTYERLLGEQPVLMDKMARYIAANGRDPEEVGRMMIVFSLTYRLVESQAEADDLNKTIDLDPGMS